MRSSVPVLVGLVLVALLTLICSCRVEKDVQASADAALASSESEWALAAADGRFVTVSGTAPSPAAVAAALAAVEARGAVTRVTDATQLRPVREDDLDPVRAGFARERMRWVDLSWHDWTLELSGMAASEPDRQRAFDTAGPLWPWGPVDNRIRVAGAGVDQAALGCRAELNVLLEAGPIQFETDSAALRAESRRRLDALAAALGTCPDSRVGIEAHSDSSGESGYNLTISQERADSVVEYLVSAGVDAARLTARGFGESRPIADNSTDAGRALNRRVEFRLGY